MYVFIAIIFIAELIIAGFILYWICRADAWALKMNRTVIRSGADLIAAVKIVRKSLSLVFSSIQKINLFVERKKAEFWRRIINLIIIYILLYILRIRFKKAATFCQCAVFLKDCWDSIPG